MEFLYEGEWLSREEAGRRMMLNAIRRIATEHLDAAEARDLACDVLGFVEVDGEVPA